MARIPQLLLAVALTAGGLTACGDDDSEDASQKLCDKKDEVLDHLGGSDHESVLDRLKDSLEDLGSAAEDVSKSAWDEVKVAHDKFQETVETDESTDQSSRDEARTKAKSELNDAWNALFKKAGC